MAPYTPPNSHYSEMDVSEYDEEQVFAFIGKSGKRFYWLTRFLDLDYLWYDKHRKTIEIWGPYHTHLNKQSQHIIRAEMEHFIPKLEENPAFSQSENEHVQETRVAAECPI